MHSTYSSLLLEPNTIPPGAASSSASELQIIWADLRRSPVFVLFHHFKRSAFLVGNDFLSCLLLCMQKCHQLVIGPVKKPSSLNWPSSFKVAGRLIFSSWQLLLCTHLSSLALLHYRMLGLVCTHRFCNLIFIQLNHHHWIPRPNEML